MQVWIHGGRVLDPGLLDGRFDILVDGGRIAGIFPADPDRKRPEIPPDSATDRIPDRTIDASGLLVVPGLIDMHVHFREPGQEEKETIETGMAAAACGGFTSVCTMPNTRPAADSPETVSFILAKGRARAGTRIYPVGAITHGLKGDILCDFKALQSAGAVAVSDDGMPVMNSQRMREAMERAKELDLLVISHSEDLNLAAGGAMNEGEASRRMGVRGIPGAAETIGVMRDIALAELTGARLHIAHVSTAGSVRAIRDAKARGVSVTAETAPHYFTLTDRDVLKYGANAKMNPPLRSEMDREAVCRGLADGTLDAIATDHAPHTPREKAGNFADAPNGVVGLETSLAVSLRLVENGCLSLARLIEKMSINPARILGIDNRLKTGNPADITLVDPRAAHRIDAAAFKSKGRNTPFDGWTVTGRAVMTLVDGEIVFEAEGSSPTHPSE